MHRRALAIEWTGQQRSVAVRETGKSTGQVWITQEIFNDPGATPLPMALEKLFRDRKIRPETIEDIHINRGPGSYTGIRIALAAAQGLALAADIHSRLRFHFCTTLDILEWRVSDIGESTGIAAAGVYAQQKQVVVRWLRSDTVGNAGEGENDVILESADLIRKLRDLKSRIAGPDLEKHLPEDVLLPMSPQAGDLFSTPSNRVEADALHLVEPVYVRLQEFVKAPPAQFSGLNAAE